MQYEYIGPLVQRVGKYVINISFFLSSKVLMLTGHGDLYSSFNVILSQQKLKIKIINVNFTMHFYIMQCQL